MSRRIMTTENLEEDVRIENHLRPQLLEDYIGQTKAKEMLNTTGKYVKEIAYELGFTDDKAFIGFFKYHEGVYPSAFRSRFYMIHMNNR